MDASDMSQLSVTLFDAIMRRQSVQELIDRAYPLIGHPIIVFDTSFKLIAYHFQRPFPYDKWEEIAAFGALNEKTVDEDGSLSYQEQMYSHGKSQVFDWGVARAYPQVDAPIMWNGTLVGYVGIGIEQDPSVETLLRANDLLAEAIAIQNGSKSTKTHRLPQDLSENFLAADAIPFDAAALANTYPPPYLFAVLASDTPRVSTLEYVKSILCRENPAALAQLDKERYLFVLFYGAGADTALSEVEQQLSALATKYTLSGGISDFFRDISRCPAYRMQAMLALSVGQGQTQNIHSFYNSYLEIISYGAIERLGWDVCRLPALDALRRADAQEGTEYLKTLAVYLDCIQNSAAAAKQLGIHKNTVQYRIHKIEALLGAPLHSDKAKELQLGMVLYRLSEGLTERKDAK